MNKQFKKNRKQKGFTLIELMIVVAVIGVLAAIAVPQYQNYIKKSELGAGLATIASLKVNLEDKIATVAEFPTIATADVAAELGASSTPLGDISTVQDSGSSVAGNILLTFGTNSQHNTRKIALNRDANGQWSCLTNVPSTASSTYPKNCSYNALP
ncbi:pilin [Thaumasiovibrio subtropicus]|uniref:pilin n=1 Tax=Thaumasiovibrio subtropicus TaxID=1891207 RepID=UPI000B35A51B|nr:pilin [Thaumasiovibrio subtropicus]